MNSRKQVSNGYDDTSTGDEQIRPVVAFSSRRSWMEPPWGVLDWSRRRDPTLKRSEIVSVTEHLRRDDDNPSEDLRGMPTISDYIDLTKVCHKWRISTWRLQPWPSAESRTHRWAPETDLQWGPRHLDIHRGKTPGTSGPLTLWLCCSWNKLLIRLAGGELAPRLSLVSPKVFSPFCHRWSFRSLTELKLN